MEGKDINNLPRVLCNTRDNSKTSFEVAHFL